MQQGSRIFVLLFSCIFLFSSIKHLASSPLNSQTNKLDSQLFHCGDDIEASIYLNAERQAAIDEETKELKTDRISKDAESFVSLQEEAFNNMRKNQVARQEEKKRILNDKTMREAGVVVLQWNIELKRPGMEHVKDSLNEIFRSEEKQPESKKFENFANSKAQTQKNSINMLFMFFEENYFFSSSEAQRFSETVLEYLNEVVDVEKNQWEMKINDNLSNIVGTKLPTVRVSDTGRIDIENTTQSYFFFSRKSTKVSELKGCQHSIPKGIKKLPIGIPSEKGFVGVSFVVEGYGRVAVIGVHLNKSDRSSDVEVIMKNVAEKCALNENNKSLDYFDGGIIVVGDLNTRISPIDLHYVYTHKAKNELLKSTNQEKGNILYEKEEYWKKAYDWLINFFIDENTLEINKKYLWMTDEMNGSVFNDDPSYKYHDSPKASFFKYGFHYVGNCFRAGWTYKYQPCDVCLPSRSKTQNECTIKQIMEHCITPKIVNAAKIEKFRQNYHFLQFGYLDKIVLRLPRNKDRNMFLEQGNQVRSSAGDHTIMTWRLSFFYPEKHSLRAETK